MRSRYLMELTTPELEEYLSRGDTTAILPIGCIEMHGPHQPLGTDSIQTKAFALRVAEEAGGLVLPELHYSWAGSTDGFKGTFSIGMDLEQELVETIAVKAYRMGFKRVAILSNHGPNQEILYLCVRRIFEKYHIPVLFVRTSRPFGDDSMKLFEGEYAKAKDACCVLAALHILGRHGLYSEEEMQYEDQAPAHPASFYKLSKMGGIGYFMQDLRQHTCPTPLVSLERGLEFYKIQVGYIVSALKEIDVYAEEIKTQKNKGWYI